MYAVKRMDGLEMRLPRLLFLGSSLAKVGWGWSHVVCVCVLCMSLHV